MDLFESSAVISFSMRVMDGAASLFATRAAWPWNRSSLRTSGKQAMERGDSRAKM